MKLIKTIALLCLSFVLAIPAVNAPSAQNKSIRILVDGNELLLSKPCYMLNDKTMVPMRSLFKNLQMTVRWDEQTNAAIAEGNEMTVSFCENIPEMIVNGQAVALDAAPVVAENTMYLPLRSIAQYAGYEVSWNEKYNCVYIESQPREKLSVPKAEVTGTALSAENKKWIENALQFAYDKFAKTAGRVKGNAIFTAQNGLYNNERADNPNWWTNGFYPGMLWNLYEKTGDVRYAQYAGAIEDKFAELLINNPSITDHDIGFQWMMTGYKSYMNLGNKTSYNHLMQAADLLKGRYVENGHYIKAWNFKNSETTAIIDTMMNLELLYTASELSGDPSYKNVAMAHADTTVKEFIRADGSTQHQIVFDPESGAVVRYGAGQGYDDGKGNGSHWSRGNAWAIYGFAKSYNATGNKLYLETAQKAASYFMTHLCENGAVPCDFQQPEPNSLVDTSAGVIAASGLVDIAKATGDLSYLEQALTLLKNQSALYGGDNGEEALLSNGCNAYDEGRQVILIYGDYYYLEALSKIAIF